jgi:hypothetical protein
VVGLVRARELKSADGVVAIGGVGVFVVDSGVAEVGLPSATTMRPVSQFARATGSVMRLMSSPWRTAARKASAPGPLCTGECRLSPLPPGDDYRPRRPPPPMRDLSALRLGIPPIGDIPPARLVGDVAPVPPPIMGGMAPAIGEPPR